MAVLSARARRRLPRRDFAIPEKAPGPGSYPIEDQPHARSALSRVRQHGSPSERRRVRAAVGRRYPRMHVAGLARGGRRR